MTDIHGTELSLCQFTILTTIWLVCIFYSNLLKNIFDWNVKVPGGGHATHHSSAMSFFSISNLFIHFPSNEKPTRDMFVKSLKASCTHGCFVHFGQKKNYYFKCTGCFLKVSLLEHLCCCVQSLVLCFSLVIFHLFYSIYDPGPLSGSALTKKLKKMF